MTPPSAILRFPKPPASRRVEESKDRNFNQRPPDQRQSVVDHWRAAEASSPLSPTLPDNGGLTRFIDFGDSAILL